VKSGRSCRARGACECVRHMREIEKFMDFLFCFNAGSKNDLFLTSSNSVLTALGWSNDEQELINSLI